MDNNIINDLSKIAETISEDTRKEFFEMVESIPTESDEMSHIEGILTSKREQLGLSDGGFSIFTFYLLGKLHGGNNVKT